MDGFSRMLCARSTWKQEKDKMAANVLIVLLWQRVISNEIEILNKIIHIISDCPMRDTEFKSL